MCAKLKTQHKNRELEINFEVLAKTPKTGRSVTNVNAASNVLVFGSDPIQILNQMHPL